MTDSPRERDTCDEYLDDRQSRADAAILGASGYLDLARRERDKNPRAFQDDEEEFADFIRNQRPR